MGIAIGLYSLTGATACFKDRKMAALFHAAGKFVMKN
jgi:hypothetical protein